MEQKTRNQRVWLVIGVWVAAVALVVAIGVLVFLEIYSARARQAQQNAALSESVADSVQMEPAEEAVPEQTEETTAYIPESVLPLNPYTGEDFGYRGRYLTCTTGPCLLGIDVSFWQGDINWSLVKAAGMEFAMIRLAWRGSDEGHIEADSYAAINYEGAKQAGVQLGGYFFSQAITPEEAVEEAEFVLEMIKDWKFEMPIVFDWEFAGGARTVGMDARAITDCAKAFCQTIEDAGYDAMIYFNPDAAENNLYLEELKDYGFWLAMWDTEMDFPYRVNMWQYTDSGSVPGIYGNVDLDIYFLYEE